MEKYLRQQLLISNLIKVLKMIFGTVYFLLIICLWPCGKKIINIYGEIFRKKSFNEIFLEKIVSFNYRLGHLKNYDLDELRFNE